MAHKTTLLEDALRACNMALGVVADGNARDREFAPETQKDLEAVLRRAKREGHKI